MRVTHSNLLPLHDNFLNFLPLLVYIPQILNTTNPQVRVIFRLIKFPLFLLSRYSEKKTLQYRCSFTETNRSTEETGRRAAESRQTGQTEPVQVDTRREAISFYS